MFAVKAEVNSQTGPNTFQLFQAASVHVNKSNVNGANGPGMPPFVAPELEVELLDEHNRHIRFLEVGHGIAHYCAIYVMNDRGKTVESIYPGPQPVTSFKAA